MVVVKAKKIIALDLGTKVGITFNGKRAETHIFAKTDDRYYSFMKFIDYEITNSNCDVVAYEAAAFQQGNAIPVYHGFVGILKAMCVKHSKELVGIPVGTIKKCFTGKGNANKLDIKAQCDKLGLLYDDDNSADALAVYYTYKKLYEDK